MDFDAETMGVLRQAVRARLEKDYSAQDSVRDPEAVQLEQEVATARILHEKKPITEELIRRSLDYEHWVFVKACLIVRSGCSMAAVRQILKSERPDAVLSLCWKAGLWLGYGGAGAAPSRRDLDAAARPTAANSRPPRWIGSSPPSRTRFRSRGFRQARRFRRRARRRGPNR